MNINNYMGALQKPLGLGFNGRSTAAEVVAGIDLSGKTAIVTGGNTGIGLETTKVLAGAGAKVIVLARDVNKAAQNLAGMHDVRIEPVDLMNPLSIDDFADRYIASERSLDLLINNAGIMWVPLRRDSRGVESQLATNYLAQFHLAARLFPALAEAGNARVVNVSSQGHQFASFDFDDPGFRTRPYNTLAAYGQSKTATNLFTVELDMRAKGRGVRVFSVHPGSIGGTELAREAPLELFQQMGFLDADGNMRPEVAASLKTIPQGAATTVWCATSPSLSNLGGVYCEDADVAVIADDEAPMGSPGVKLYSLDKESARGLWRWSEEVTGLHFDL